MKSIIICMVGIVIMLTMVNYLSADPHVMRKLSWQEQASLRGGGCDIDCEVVGNCHPGSIPCVQDACCPTLLTPRCVETDSKETCTAITQYGLDCVVEDSEECSPAKYFTQMCVGNICQVSVSDAGSCNDTATKCSY